MRKFYLIIQILIVMAILSGCTKQGTAQPVSSTDVATQEPNITATIDRKEPAAPIEFKVLYTSDEHGWMEGQAPGQGAANMLGLWEKDFGYPNNGRFLVLSGGDNWTGPAISSWYQGESMLQVMELMGYQASAVGNHEFDFGLDALKQRLNDSTFPFLGSNIRYKDNELPPTDLGIKPFTVIDLDGLSVGVIGLSSKATEYTANPAIVGAFTFDDYANALEKSASELRQNGVQVLLVTTHLCLDELIELVPTAEKLGIAWMGGGHCHMSFSQKIGGVGLTGSAAYLQSYAFADLLFDPDTAKTTLSDIGVRPNKDGEPDADVAAVVKNWAERTEVEGGVKIGFIKNEISKQSDLMQTLITESWLWEIPQADIALTNLGGMRDRLPAGYITLAQITSMMPFNNTIVEVKLTGSQLQKILEAKLTTPPAMGGIHLFQGKWVLNKTGEPLDVNAIYTVLVNDFMYAGGDRYTDLAKYDPDAYFTAIDWRQPVIDWIKAQETNESTPLDPLIQDLVP